ncbi:MAG: hypothetical protein ABW092_20770, partial [Candidatus Thiodiazotropha sp.]
MSSAQEDAGCATTPLVSAPDVAVPSTSTVDSDTSSQQSLTSVSRDSLGFKDLRSQVLQKCSKGDSFIFILPDDEEDFREDFFRYINEIDWSVVRKVAEWIVTNYGKGKRSCLAHRTKYVQWCDSFVDHVFEQYNVNLDSVLLQHTPGMLRSEDQNFTFICHLVAITEIGHMFCTTIDVSDDLPRPDGCPSPRGSSPTPRESSPVRTSSPVQDLVESPVVSPIASPWPVVSPCKVVLERVVLDHSPPIGSRPRSRSVKRRAPVVTDSDPEDVIPATPKKRVARSKHDVSDREEVPQEKSHEDSLEKSLSGQEDDHGRDSDKDDDGEDGTDPKVVMRMLQERGVGCENHVRKQLRETNEYLLMYYRSFVQQSDRHKNNMTNNMARLLGWFSKDKDPFKFTLSDLASVEKLQGLAQLFVDCKVRGETRHKYFQTITGFIKAVGKSKYKQTHGHLMSVLDDVKEEAEVQKARASVVKGKERMQKAAKMALQQDDSLEQLKAFTKQVDTTLKDVVRGIFKECMKDKKKRVSDSDLRVVNVFWMCQAIKWGQRPGAVTGMDKMCYKRAKASEPSTTYGGLQAVGPCRFLVTSDHKTGSHELAFIPIPMKEEWSWLEFYYTYMRPSPKDQSAMKLLFRNSEGSK